MLRTILPATSPPPCCLKLHLLHAKSPRRPASTRIHPAVSYAIARCVHGGGREGSPRTQLKPSHRHMASPQICACESQPLRMPVFVQINNNNAWQAPLNRTKQYRNAQDSTLSATAENTSWVSQVSLEPRTVRSNTPERPGCVQRRHGLRLQTYRLPDYSERTYDAA